MHTSKENHAPYYEPLKIKITSLATSIVLYKALTCKLIID